ncbi:CNO10 protein, partial [Polypterus senegalus]
MGNSIPPLGCLVAASLAGGDASTSMGDGVLNSPVGNWGGHQGVLHGLNSPAGQLFSPTRKCNWNKSGNYDLCLQHLKNLQDLNKDEYKIAMNKAIAEFFKSGQTTTETLKQALAALKNQVHAAVDEMDGLDDVENSLLYYNQAVIQYHMRQYSEAVAIGEKLYQFLEPFEEKFAQAVSFLLVDLYLLTYQPETALHLLAVLEKLTVQGNNKNGKNEAANNSNKEGINQKADYIAMMEAAKSKIHQSAPSLFLKSNFEYLRGNYRKAVKLLNSSNIAEHPGVMKTGECVRCMFWNNLGCIHFAMAKHNLGIFYFKKALQENDHTSAKLAATSNGQAKKFQGIPMCTLLANKRYELLYNCGIQLLHIGRPLAAFECLIEAVQVYHSNPRLWLSEGQSAAIPVASMEFAAICLRNALLLLPEDQQETKSENGSKNSSQSGSIESSSESGEMCR